MTDKVQKIREEVEKKLEVMQYQVHRKDAYKELKGVLAYIDSLQEEPINDDLKEASRNYADKEKFRKDVEKLKSNLIHGACASQIAMETRCKEEAYNEVLAILDTMQEEPVSEDLEEAANMYAKEEYNHKNPATLPDKCIGCYAPLMYAFKAGAKWQKEQMMARAIDAVVSQVPCANEIILRNPESVHWFYLPQEMNKLGINKGDKVKLIIIKEE